MRVNLPHATQGVGRITVLLGDKVLETSDAVLPIQSPVELATHGHDEDDLTVTFVTLLNSGLPNGEPSVVKKPSTAKAEAAKAAKEAGEKAAAEAEKAEAEKAEAEKAEAEKAEAEKAEAEKAAAAEATKVSKYKPTK